jgi:hypothetical protein
MVLTNNNRIILFSDRLINYDYEPEPNTGFYSNLNQYIINGVRQASTSSTIRTNVSISNRLIVTSTIVISGFKFVRIPPDNWASTSGYFISPTLSVVSGTGASIDGSSSSKSFNARSVVYNPLVGRSGGLTQYDIHTMTPTNASTTTLTSGQYTITLLGTAANMNMAILTNSLFPIDTTKNIYPSPIISSTHLVIEIF